MARSWWRRKVHDRVIVHTTDDRSLCGVLVAVYGSELVLGHAEYLHAAGREALEGEVAIPRDRIAFVQSLPSRDSDVPAGAMPG